MTQNNQNMSIIIPSYTLDILKKEHIEKSKQIKRSIKEMLYDQCRKRNLGMCDGFLISTHVYATTSSGFQIKLETVHAEHLRKNEEIIKQITNVQNELSLLETLLK